MCVSSWYCHLAVFPCFLSLCTYGRSKIKLYRKEKSYCIKQNCQMAVLSFSVFFEVFYYCQMDVFAMLFDGRVYLQYTFTGNSTTKTSIWRPGKSASGKFRKIHINRGIWVGKHPFGQQNIIIYIECTNIYSKTKQLHYIKIHIKSEKGNLTMPKSGIFFISSIETILPIWALYASADFF